MITSKLNRLATRLSATLFFMMVVFCPACLRGSTFSATKTLGADGKYTVTTSAANFTIASAQYVNWNANYLGKDMEGKSFYLNQNPSDLTQILLDGNLAPGYNASVAPVLLAAGTYSISATYSGMGQGTYTVTYDQSPPQLGVLTCDGDPNIGSANLWFGGKKLLTRSFKNTGTGPLTLSSFIVSPPGIFSLPSAPSTAPLGVGETRNVSILFAPRFAISYSGFLSIKSSDPHSPTACRFTATGYSPFWNIGPPTNRAARYAFLIVFLVLVGWWIRQRRMKQSS